MKIKRNKKSYKWFLCGLILVVVLTISYRVSKANYRISNSIELTTGKVISSPYDFNIVSMYIDGVEQDKSTILPSTIANYTINEEETYCYKESKSNRDNNAKISINVLGELVIKGISKGSKCILSLNTKTNSAKTMSELLNSHYIIKNDRSADNKDFNVPFTKTTYGVVYSAPDDDGTSYYFAGNPLDNWVEFGGYYWRIIRINGNGSIRVIYQGRTQDENGNRLEPQATGEETQIGTSTFNTQYTEDKYIGFMYEEDGNLVSSTIKQELDNWYNVSGLKYLQDKYIDTEAGFCGDRTAGAGNFYAPLLRLRLENQNVNPTLNCFNDKDLYTYEKASSGNKKLVNPVGLITADETSLTGLVCWLASENNYLITKMLYWTMTPYSFGNDIAEVFYVGSNGGTYNHWTNIILGVRPVINLRSDVEFTGNGTESSPYKVVY